jgi:hypothetical protein
VATGSEKMIPMRCAGKSATTGSKGTSARTLLRRCACSCALVILGLVLSQTAAFAGTTYVDGLSDQKIEWWNTTGTPAAGWWNGEYQPYSFPEFFSHAWIADGHIRYARYVIQWNALSLPLEGNQNHRERFEAWYHDMTSAPYNLLLDLSLTVYNQGETPPSTEKYKAELANLLNWGEKQGHPFRYVEAWNEPNAQGRLNGEPEKAAEFTSIAYKTCEAVPSHCTVIGGNVEDEPNRSNGTNSAKEWEEKYIKKLRELESSKTVPVVWGIHPYVSVHEKSLAPWEAVAGPVKKLREEMKWAAEPLWITEVGAFYCKNHEGVSESYGAGQQAKDAEWLVGDLMPEKQPPHVFYYDFYETNEAERLCANSGDADTTLFEPGGSVPFRPRPAASWIYANVNGAPWAYTQAADGVYKRTARLKGAVYTGGLETKFWFEYGTVAGQYNAGTLEAKVPAGQSFSWATSELTSLTPNTTYHYRLGAYNGSGVESFGPDKQFTTEAAPPSAFTEPATEVTRTSAKLEGQVYPDGLPTEYYFLYNEVGGASQSTAKLSAGGDESWHWENATTSLKSCMKYQFQIMAANADPPSPVSGGVQEFTTKCTPPEVKAKEGGATNITREGATVEAFVLARGLDTLYHFNYGTSTSYGSVAPVPDGDAGSGTEWVLVSTPLSGLEVCQAYHYSLFAKSEDGSVEEPDQTFMTTCIAPEVSTGGPSEVQPRTAVLNGAVNPEGQATKYHFEYGTTTSYGSLGSEGSAGEGRGFVEKSTSVAVKPCRTYDYRLSAWNATGTKYGANKTFTTPAAPPVVSGVKATEIKPTSVVVNAEVNPEECETTYHFEYGTTTSYGTSVPVPDSSVGAGATKVTVSDALVGLVPGVTYHYRVAAQNKGNTVYSADQSLKTPVDWEVSGKIAGLTAVKAEGSVIVEDRGLGVAVECTIRGEGSVTSGTGELTKVTGAGGESLMVCPIVKKTGVCEGTTTEVEATHLPWKTELVDEVTQNEKGEMTRYEVRHRFFGASAPGWVVKCKSVWFTGGVGTDTCTGETSGNTENAAGGVPVEFDSKSAHLVCSGTSKEAVGVIEGALVVASTTEGSKLSASGAKTGPLPPVVTTSEATGVTSSGATLKGTVAAKGVETTYRFEYGSTSWFYEHSIPVPNGSAGSGRTRIEVSQALDGLEPSVLYHYRLVATNSAGTSYGEDKTFTTGYPAKWYVNGKEAFFNTVKGEGTVIVEDRGLGASAECAVSEAGSVIGKTSELTKVTGTKGETVISCHVVKKTGLCEGTTVEVEPANLPWKTELVDEPVSNGFGTRYEVRDRLYGTTPPGWVVKCKEILGLGTASDTCAGETSGNTENATGGVPVEFDARSPRLVCNGSSKEAVGVVEGALLIAATTEGSTLSAYGAKTGPLPPAVVTGEATSITSSSATLNGTVAAKGVATTYRFEYGPGTSYGSSVPVPNASAGSGRTRIEVSQAISGLEPSVQYHYRIAATNSAGTTYGEDRTFTTGYPAKWLVNGKESLFGSVKAEGTMVVEDRGLGVTAECAVLETGSASAKSGEVTKVTGTKAEAVISCHLAKSTGLCEGTTVEAEPANLPWKTELVDEPVKTWWGEVIRYEVRNRFYGATQPGWTIKCKEVLGLGTASDTCAGETSTNVENVTAGVPAEWDTKSLHLTCSGTSKEAVGSVEGVIVFASTTEGSTLSAYGAKTGPLAPTVVTGEATSVTSSGATLNGTVAAKGTASTYHFEYGPSTSYGTSIPATPASAGAGRTRVEVSQTVTGAEPGILYHYRLAATNSAGTSYGEDKTFTPGYPAKWYLNGKEAFFSPVKGEGTVIVEDRGLGVSAECTVSETGNLFGKTGEITKATGSKGETVISCPIAKKTGLCEGTTVEVEPANLPWKTELIDQPVKNEKGEVVRYEVRDRYYGTTPPGWTVKCKSVWFTGGVGKDTCAGEISGNTENITAGVPVEFDAKSTQLACTGTSKEAVGVVEGTLVFASTTEGSTLSVYGASSGPLPPTVVTDAATSVSNSGATLNGTVAAKAAATTYRFEYGTSTSYGSDVPVPDASAGSARLRVEVSQPVSGLEPSVVYHYRLVATNSSGTSYGEDKTFTTGYTAKWLVNGKEALFTQVTAEGTIVLEDRGLGVLAECTIKESGEGALWSGSTGSITKVTGTKGETAITCHAVKQGVCGAAPIELEATSLPWKTELIDEPIRASIFGEVTGYEVRNRFYGTTAPGWALRCKYSGSTAIDTCVGETSGNVENITTGVPIEFDPKTKQLTCSGSAKGVGVIEGALVFKSTTEGSTLSVSGAKNGPLPPAVVTREATSLTGSSATLNGTVAAKGASTTYHFEYGTTTGYGSSVPVPNAPAGEARTRIEVSQTATSLAKSTTYHYRVVATNSAGTTYGEDKTFTTI